MILGIRVKPTNGEAYDVWGYAYWKYVDGQKYWYCAGLSFSDGTVVAMYEIDLTAEQIYRICAVR